MKNTERFTGKADAYEQSRPDYPAEALACVQRECNLAPGSIVADIGAGTGKFTRALLTEGCGVVAVEPNADMLTTLRANFTQLRIIEAPAEATTLPDHSVDTVTVAQAFHWFDHAACKVEFKRVLKPGGKVAVLYNTRDGALAQEHGDLMQQYRVREAVSIENPRDVYTTFFRTHETHHFANKQDFDEARLLALTFSRSYAPAPDDPQYPVLVQAVKELFAKYAQGGIAEYCYKTSVVIGEL